MTTDTTQQHTTAVHKAARKSEGAETQLVIGDEYNTKRSVIMAF